MAATALTTRILIADFRVSASGLSTAVSLMTDRNKPKKSGDKGPEKNFRKKIMKKVNKLNASMSPDVLMKNLKFTETGIDESSDHTDSSLEELLSGFSTRQDRDAVREKRQKNTSEDANFVSSQAMRPINFSQPDSGQRLSVFEPLSPHMKVMPVGKQNITEEQKQKSLENIRLLQTTSYFEDLKKVPFPRQFPVDNENYVSPESEVNFKDHVLLDDLIKEFPAKGPVRHFMELVVTGLSMNPDYSVSQKRDFITWYRHYFSTFSSSELQALPSHKSKSGKRS